jgi:hypothetical protein
VYNFSYTKHPHSAEYFYDLEKEKRFENVISKTNFSLTFDHDQLEFSSFDEYLIPKMIFLLCHGA